MKNNHFKLPLIICILFFIFQIAFNPLKAQTGTIDYSFDVGTGGNDWITALSVQADNKIVIGGRFSQFNGVSNNHIARLHPNGDLDTTFNSGTGFSSSISSLEIHSMAIQNDGKIIVGGDFNTYNGVSSNYLVRLNSNGSIDSLFNPNIGLGVNIKINAIALQPNGKILIGGSFSSFNSVSVLPGATTIVRLNSDGSIDSTFTNLTLSGGILGITYTNDIKIQPDNKILVGGAFNTVEGVVCKNIIRLNADGSLDAGFNLGLSFTSNSGFTEIQSILLHPDEKINIGGSFNSCNGITMNTVARLNPNGTLDSTFIPTAISTGLKTTNMALQPNGKILVAGIVNFYYPSDTILANGIGRLNQDGSIDETFNTKQSAVTLLGVNTNNTEVLHVQSDGRILLGGNFDLFNSTILVSNLIRLQGDRGIYSKVYNDLDSNCINTTNEIGLEGRILTINPGNIIVYTNSKGIGHVDSLPAGTYTITADTTPVNWLPTCSYTQNFTVLHPDSFVVIPPFGFISTAPCSAPNISIVMPFMRPCFNGQRIYVDVCNQTTATGMLNNAQVEVQLDSMLTVTGCSLPYVDLGNNLYSVNIGNLSPGACTNFNFLATLSCNAILGQTLCMQADISPVDSCSLDSIPNFFPNGINPCNTPYDNSSLTVESSCDNDTIYFTIQNTGGGDMSCFSQIRLLVDGVLSTSDSIQLLSGDTAIYTFAADGRTWRLEVDQHPLHPGNSHPSSTIELCGDTVNWTPNLVAILPQNDADPIVDIFCGVVTGSFDPNDKTGYPLGVTATNDILPNQSLEYLIRFQNTGTDTAFTVVIRDTLSFDLDIYSVLSEVSSHNYNFRMYGPRVLEWTFNDIMLPDSNVNEAASHGFIKFKVDQAPNLPNETLIQNSAAIYFDFNAPIITNTSWHTIKEYFLPLGVNKMLEEQLQIKVYPNPTNNLVYIDRVSNQEISILVVDNVGQVLIAKKSTTSITSIDLGNLPTGIYYLSINNGKQTATQKILKQ